MPNPLGVFLCHEHACEAMGEALHVPIACCMHEIALLHCRPRSAVEGVFFMPAQELTAQLGKERCVIARWPDHAEGVCTFCEHFGLEYLGATLCASVGAMLEKLLRQKRLAFSDAVRDEHQGPPGEA